MQTTNYKLVINYAKNDLKLILFIMQTTNYKLVINYANDLNLHYSLCITFCIGLHAIKACFF